MTNDSTGPHGPKYFINIEGTIHEWDRPTITTEEILRLGGWEATLGVLEIDLKTNESRTLAPGQTIELRPGQGFAKKVQWKRGYALTERVSAELRLLRGVFPDIVYSEDGHWFMIPDYPAAEALGWTPRPLPVAFHAQPGHPGQAPYGIWVPSGIRVAGSPPSNIQDPASRQPPFPGSWALLSWTSDGDQWRPRANIAAGSNLVNYAIGFRDRFLQGV